MKPIIASLLLIGLAFAAGEPQAITPGKTSGVPTAPIRLEVFSDFQCPSCKALYEESLKPLMTDYVAKGKIYFIHRDFPLTMHPHAREAAAYADSVGHVNVLKYELVCAELFRQQSNWAASGRIDATVAAILSPEEMKKVRALINDKKIASEIEQDIALGNQASVSQTPTMLVIHKGRTFPLTGAISYPLLRRFLDDLLSN